jgi:putrescine aminotransferase
VLLIADEVITGFGRTGELFGLNRYGVQPDILSFAKAITSGYQPLGGNQITDAIYDTIQSAPDTDSWMHGYTYSGHATACAVALRNLEIIEQEKLVEQGRQRGERLLAGLQSLKEFSIVGDVRGIGLICAVELVSDKATKAADPALTAKVARLCQERGLRTRNVGSTLAFAPPLIISEAEVDEIVRILGGVLDTLA